MQAVAPDTRLAGRYVLEELIATGGMATVWRARDEVLARTVAVKVLQGQLGEDPAFAERFRREAVAAARLSHPNIISVFDTGEDGGVYFIVMEYLEGTTLSGLLREQGRLESDRAVALMLPVLSALAYAHDAGVVHRDVKPANILVGMEGRVKVTDFGIAKAAFPGRDLTDTGNILGTVRYLSPEQVQGDAVDARSDVYSSGVVLYELITGRPPFEGDNDLGTALARLSTEPIPPRAIVGGLFRELESIILRALARRPEDRFPTAEAMRAALERHASGGEPTLPGMRPVRPTTTGGLPIAAPMGTAPPPAAVQAPRTAARHRSVVRSWVLVPVVIMLLAVAALATGFAIGRLEFGGPLGVRGANQGVGNRDGSVAVEIASAQDFDPDGDGSEHPGDVSKMLDGDPSTTWGTDHYNSAEFGQLKPGLGVWFDLGGTSEVTSLIVRSPLSAWTFELHSGPSPDQATSVLEASDGSKSFTADPSGTTSVELGSPVGTDGILIWITKLAPDGGRFAVKIGEVTVEGPAA
jgi:hypothetical protein